MIHQEKQNGEVLYVYSLDKQIKWLSCGMISFAWHKKDKAMQRIRSSMVFRLRI